MKKKMNKNTTNKPSLIRSNEKGLEIRRVSKSYNNRPVVREVSFQINKGEAVGLLGPNGSGKTTLFYTIIGLIRPNTGNIFLNGFDVTDFWENSDKMVDMMKRHTLTANKLAELIIENYPFGYIKEKVTDGY